MPETLDPTKDVSGDKAEKFIIMAEQDVMALLKKAVKEGAREGIAAYEKKQARIISERSAMVRNNAKTLVKHYRQLKEMEKTSVYDSDTVTDLTLSGIFDYMLDECQQGEFELTSTKKNMLITGMLMNHIDIQLENYKRECERSNIPEIQRRYRIIEMLYLNNRPVKVDDVAEVENIDKSNVYRTLEKAYDDLAALFFGVEGLNAAERRKIKSRNRKRNRDSDE